MLAGRSYSRPRSFQVLEPAILTVSSVGSGTGTGVGVGSWWLVMTLPSTVAW